MRFLRDRVKKYIPVKGTEIHLTRVVLVTMLIRLKDIPMTGTEMPKLIGTGEIYISVKDIPMTGTEMPKLIGTGEIYISVKNIPMTRTRTIQRKNLV